MKEKLEPVVTSDADLFQQAVAGTTPLPAPNRLVPTPAKRRPQSHSAPPAPIPDTLSDHGAGDIALHEFLSSGLNQMTLRKLRRGHWPPQDHLDLHGLSSDAARQLLQEFLHHASQQQLRCVNVIHGKGWQANGNEGVLKIRTRHWLSQHPQVLAFCEPPVNAGGSGTVWVLLKMNNAAKS